MGAVPKLMAVTAPLFEIDDLSVSAADRTEILTGVGMGVGLGALVASGGRELVECLDVCRDEGWR